MARPGSYTHRALYLKWLAWVTVALGIPGVACQARVQPESDPPSTRSIVGGAVATACQWPTAIMVLPIGCSGTLVHSRAFITARHCLVDASGNPGKPTAVGIGDSKASFAKTVAVAQCYGHPVNDFAICTLKEDVPDVPIVPVMATCEMVQLKQGAGIVEAGFGTNAAGTGGVYGTKRWIAGTIVADATGAAQIDVTTGSQDGEYFGDSGGPLFLRMPDKTWRLVGEDCCSDDIVPGSSTPRISTYVSVPYHVVWAEQQIGLDLTPCHDSDGWVAGPSCNGFPTNPDRSGGTWSTMCQGQDLYLSRTCALTRLDGGPGDSSADRRAADGAAELVDANAGEEDAAAETRAADATGFDVAFDVAGLDGAAGSGGSGGGGTDSDSGNLGGTGSGGLGGGGGSTSGASDSIGGMATGGGLALATGGIAAAAGGRTLVGGHGASAPSNGGAGGSKGTSTSSASSASSGCSCRLQGRSPSGSSTVFLALLGLAIWLRPRRRAA